MTKDALGKPELEKLATKLRELREAGTYPVEAAALFKQVQLDADPKALASSRAASAHVRILAVGPSPKTARPAAYYSNAPVLLPEDLTSESMFGWVLTYYLKQAATDATKVHAQGSILGLAPTAVAETLKSALLRCVQQRSLPTGVGMLRVEGHWKLFLLENMIAGPRAATPAATSAHPSSDGIAGRRMVTAPPFPEAFRQAFDELDQATGRRNYVLLHDLRQRLATIPRPDFDQGLNELRRSQKYSLDSADGRHVRLTPEQIDAGIREAGSVLVYVARR
jgi:hypothetical protein